MHSPFELKDRTQPVMGSTRILACGWAAISCEVSTQRSLLQIAALGEQVADGWGDRVCATSGGGSTGVSDSSCRCGRLRARGRTALCSPLRGPRRQQLHLNPLRLAQGSAGLGPATFSKHLRAQDLGSLW